MRAVVGDGAGGRSSARDGTGHTPVIPVSPGVTHRVGLDAPLSRDSMKRLASSVMCAVALVVGAGRPGAAQGNPQTRDGFFIGFGIGSGSLGCDDCSSRESAASGYLKMGGTINQHLLIGGQVDVWTKTVNNATLSFGNVAAMVYFYPAIDGGLFLMGGIGGASIRLQAGTFDSQTDGPGFTAGLGYDWRVGKSFALTPYATVLAGHFDGGNANMYHLGLGFTWP
jgi:hypothetical protein